MYPNNSQLSPRVSELLANRYGPSAEKASAAPAVNVPDTTPGKRLKGSKKTATNANLTPTWEVGEVGSADWTPHRKPITGYHVDTRSSLGKNADERNLRESKTSDAVKYGKSIAELEAAAKRGFPTEVSGAALERARNNQAPLYLTHVGTMYGGKPPKVVNLGKKLKS